MQKLIFLLVAFLISGMARSQDLKPSETQALLNVVVTSMHGVARPGEQIKFVGVKSKKTFSGITNTAGKFSILIPKGDIYDIQYKTFSESVDYSKIEVANETGKITLDLDIQYDPPQVYTLKNVLFETGKSVLRPESNVALNDLVAILKLKPKMIIEISGHTDNVGSAASNLKLSLDRAKAVKDYLILHGIAANRLTAQGYGDIQPVDTNDTDEGRQQNRRTEVRIISE
ncbi:MAG: OmpA family protein [Bacteroidota bacterium]